tara:strand:- start:26424 stop:27305 length:882 start_codon:yes stop_codon:yes gene_type:complete
MEFIQIKKRIKIVLKYFGLYKNKGIWSEISNRKKQYFINNVRIKTSKQTILEIKNTIENKKKGAYMRFGDEDIYLMLGEDGALHKTNKKMAKEMKEAMKCNIGVNHFALPINSNLFGLEEGMSENMHLVPDKDAIKYLGATYKYNNNNNIYTPVALHYLATFNQPFCTSFLNFLKSTSPIFVGNQNTKPELVEKLFGGLHIKCPSVNSYTDIDRVEIELEKLLRQKEYVFQVVVMAMGCPGRILQKRILKKGYNVYLFDFGSLLDAFNDDNTRLWIDLAGGSDNLKNILKNIY